MWAMFLHLSVFLGYVVPIAGLLVPIIIWQTKKEDLPILDQHGKNLVNWIISFVLYGAVFVLLAFVVIGVPLLMLLGLLAIIFPIVAGIKANNGEVWKYPLSIAFLK
ncbi:MAG: DUF4870 domain-containing protein [Planctomycetes bacterium]|nr:DUF4870 domain-containing protein [Planctomycetota bacterium]